MIRLLVLGGVFFAGLGSGSVAPGAETADEKVRLCAGQPISLSVFSEPAGYENEKTGLAKALRKLTSELGWMPQKNWRLFHRSKRRANLVHGELERRHKYAVSFERNGEKWRWVGSGDCNLEAFRQGATVGRWYRHRGQDYDASTTQIRVDVYEMGCAGGAAPTGRVMKPEIEYLPDSVMVTYFIRNPKGTFACPTAPPVTRTLKLAEPLGNRSVVDGGTYPYRLRARAPGSEGFFDPVFRVWFAGPCVKGVPICVSVFGPSRVQVGKSATYRVRVRARELLTRVRVVAVLGVNRQVRRSIGRMPAGAVRKMKFRTRCEELGGPLEPELTMVPTVDFVTHSNGKPRAFFTYPIPRVKCS